MACKASIEPKSRTKASGLPWKVRSKQDSARMLLASIGFAPGLKESPDGGGLKVSTVGWDRRVCAFNDMGSSGWRHDCLAQSLSLVAAGREPPVGSDEGVRAERRVRLVVGIVVIGGERGVCLFQGVALVALPSQAIADGDEAAERLDDGGDLGGEGVFLGAIAIDGEGPPLHRVNQFSELVHQRILPVVISRMMKPGVIWLD